MPERTWVSSPGTQADSWRHRRFRKSAVSEYMTSRRRAEDWTRLIRFLQFPEVLEWPAREWKSMNKTSRNVSQRGFQHWNPLRCTFGVALQWFFFPVCTRKRSIRSERDEKEIMMRALRDVHRHVWIATVETSVRLGDAMRQKMCYLFWQERAPLDTIAANN